MAKEINGLQESVKRIIGSHKEAPAEMFSTAPEDAKAEEHKTKPATTTVCYQIPKSTAAKIRYIAGYDRKKIGALVAEIMERYATEWERSDHGEALLPPKALDSLDTD